MKLLATFAFLFFIPSYVYSQTLLDFDELLPSEPGALFFDGYGTGVPENMPGTWESQGAVFNTRRFGPGWSYSKVNDTTTPGFMNQWAAITGTDVSGDGNYALANSFSDNGAIINLPSGQRAVSMFVTNSTFAFLSMLNGDQFADPFGGSNGTDPDWFSVTFAGFEDVGAAGAETGSVEFLLADFRFANNAEDFIVDQWTPLDLSIFGNARSIAVEFDSSDFSMFGINTPAYVAIDELQLMPLLGDLNLDGVVDLLDVSPFVSVLLNDQFDEQADINLDGIVDLSDVSFFVDLLL